MQKLKTWFHNLSSVGKVSVIAVIALSGLFTASAMSTPSNTPETVPLNSTNTNSSLNKIEEQTPVISTKTETTTESVPFDTTTVDTSDLPSGQTKVQTEGVNGEKTIIYTITLTNGIETNRTSQETITKEPVNKVIQNGTYVAPVKTRSNCDPNYSGCVPIASDVDCSGGSGNGPAYVKGPVQVIGRDIYGLDRDGDGWGCE
jgi:hypothetical protein